jgi:hypothetical protein
MSNPLAIAAVTATLQSILIAGLKGSFSTIAVSIQPLDKARPSGTNSPQVNLFLYQVARNAAWSNADMPGRTLPGELGIPPLPLNLYYLLTVYGDHDDIAEPGGHEILGRAMSVLYDHPVLSADDIKNATVSIVTGNDLADQIERVRVTHHPIGVDELSKLWTGFATQYRLSVAYEVGVALIESTRATVAPLPVLTRGPGDSGYSAQGNLLPTVPTLNSITPPNSNPAALLGDTITLAGYNFDGAQENVTFTHGKLAASNVEPVNVGSTDTLATVDIPVHPAKWPPGVYDVTLSVQRAGEGFVRITDKMPLAIAPRITIAPHTTPAGNVTLTIACTPEIWANQRVSLLIGDMPEILYAWPNPAPALTNSLSFPNIALAKGVYHVRLRVDGVDSLLVDRTKKPPVYQPSQRVIVT